MGTLLLYAAVALVAVGVLYGLGVTVLPKGEQIAPPLSDAKPWALKDGALDARDVEDVRLPIALRGYRFAEVDALLDRLAADLTARDAEIARLRGEPVPAVTAVGGGAAAMPGGEPSEEDERLLRSDDNGDDD